MDVDLFGMAPGPAATPWTTVILPDGRRLDARYEVVALARVFTSHHLKGDDLIHRRGYPARIQFREYAGPRGTAAKQVVFAAARALDPDQLLDPTHTTVAGPPLVASWPTAPARGGAHTGGDDESGRAARDQTPDPAHDVPADALVCVAGNQRCMLLLVAGALSVATRRGVVAYVRALRQRLRELHMDLAPVNRILGLDPDDHGADDADPETPARTPILVRVLERWGDGTPFPEEHGLRAAEFGRINRASDGSFTKARDLASLAHSLAADVRHIEGEPVDALLPPPRTPLAHLVDTLPNAQSLARYFKARDGRDCFGLLVGHGAVPKADVAAYLDPYTKRLNQAGRATMEAMVGALAFDDPAVQDVAPERILSYVHRSLPDLLATTQCRPHHGEWNLTRRLGDALRLLGRYEAGVRAANRAPPDERLRPAPGLFAEWVAQRWLAVATLAANPPQDGAGQHATVSDAAPASNAGSQNPSTPAPTAARSRPDEAVADDTLPDPDTAALALFLYEHGTSGDTIAAAVAAWTVAARRAGALREAAQYELWQRPVRDRTRVGRPSKHARTFAPPTAPEEPSDTFQRLFRSTELTERLWADLTAEHTRRLETDSARAGHDTRRDDETAQSGDEPGVADDAIPPAGVAPRPTTPVNRDAVLARARAAWFTWHADRHGTPSSRPPDVQFHRETPEAGPAQETPATPPPRRPRGKPREFEPADAFATYVLAEVLGQALSEVAGQGGCPDERTCRRRLKDAWDDEHTRPLLLLYLRRTAAHRRARRRHGARPGAGRPPRTATETSRSRSGGRGEEPPP